MCSAMTGIGSSEHARETNNYQLIFSPFSCHFRCQFDYLFTTCKIGWHLLGPIGGPSLGFDISSFFSLVEVLCDITCVLEIVRDDIYAADVKHMIWKPPPEVHELSIRCFSQF